MKRCTKTNYRKKLIIKTSLIIALFAISFGTIGYYLRLMDSTADFAYRYDPDPSTFLTLNETALSEAADNLARRFPLYYMPLNQSMGAMFVNDSAEYGEISYTNVSRYLATDNHALMTGIDYLSWTYQYLAAKQEGDSVREEFARNVLLNLTTGMAMLMKVPNGGLGPDYGGILARGYAPPDAQEIWPEIFEDEFKHANGTGEFSDWRYRGYTSNDEFAGYYLFLVLATKYLGHIDYIQEKVSLIVDQLCFNMLANDFLGIHTTGSTSGITQKPMMFSNGFWAPLVLRLGAAHHPEKYEHAYYHHVANELIYLSNVEGSRTTVLSSYYPNNFGSIAVLAFLLIEDEDSPIWSHYFQGYLDSIRANTRQHRNAWINAIFLMICHENGITREAAPEDLETVSLDVQDQLQRYYNQHYPTYHRAVPEIPDEYTIIGPREILDDLGLGDGMEDLLGLKDRYFTDRPLTVEYMRPRRWVWSRNPFHVEIRDENLLRKEAGSSLSAPYWMMRYMGEIGGEQFEL